jgi:hypothetical protein
MERVCLKLTERAASAPIPFRVVYRYDLDYHRRRPADRATIALEAAAAIRMMRAAFAREEALC